MDPFSFLFNSEETEEEKPEQKVKKKRKMSLAAIKKLQAKAAEEARQLMIKQKQEYLSKTKQRVQSEWEMNHAKILVYENEFLERQNLLLPSVLKLSEIDEAINQYIQLKKTEEEWMLYLNCNRLPDPSSVSQMNSYIFVWTELDTNRQMSHCIKKTEEVMQLLAGLEDVINDTNSDLPYNFVKDVKELRTTVQNLLQDHIDRATFYLFSRIETDMIPVTVTVSKYFAKCPHFAMNLWAELITPIPSSKGKEVRQPLKVVFEEVDVTVVVPVSLLDIHKVMRAMWLSYDHWSDKCRTYECPPLPSYYNLSFYDLFLIEFDQKSEIMKQREHMEVVKKKKIAAIPPEPTLSQEILAWDSEPQRALSDEVIYRECEEEDDLSREVKAILGEYEVNLRERSFLGELLLVEVLHQPPQAKYFRFKHSVTLRTEPQKLKSVNYYHKYVPPTEEQLEEEEKLEVDKKKRATGLEMSPLKMFIATEMTKLVTIVLKLPTSVIWFERPQLANWDPIQKFWSTEDIHDFNEEDGTITFKTGRLGLMGLHVRRYCLFPYEDWLFEGSKDKGVNFYLKTSQVDLRFHIREGKVCLEAMENLPSKIMNWIIGNYYPPAKLIQHLKKGGIDIFPAPDASSYIDGIQSKHVVIERNIYQVWGLFSRSFRFKRSRFNQEAGRKNIVFQAQEIYNNCQVDYCLIQTSMCSSYILDIKEDSEHYSAEKAPFMEECVDLFSLFRKYSTNEAKRKADATCYLLIQTIKEFLSYIRPISFS